MKEKRDFREETALNASEEIALNWLAGKLGLSKSAALRHSLLHLVDDVRRHDLLKNTGVSTDD